jgi:hypothetical protein
VAILLRAVCIFVYRADCCYDCPGGLHKRLADAKQERLADAKQERLAGTKQEQRIGGGVNADGEPRLLVR